VAPIDLFQYYIILEQENTSYIRETKTYMVAYLSKKYDSEYTNASALVTCKGKKLTRQTYNHIIIILKREMSSDLIILLSIQELESVVLD